MNTYNRALITVAQSILCHPDWDEETHLAYLEQEGFNLDEDITISRYPDGPVTASLRMYVHSWTTFPTRCVENARNHANALATA